MGLGYIGCLLRFRLFCSAEFAVLVLFGWVLLIVLLIYIVVIVCSGLVRVAICAVYCCVRFPVMVGYWLCL